jgi:hypothetical protein
MALLHAAAVLALLCGPALAQEPSFEARINEALRRLKPSPRAAPRIGSWNDPKAYRWLDARTFLGPFGVRVDRSCMAFEGSAYPAAPAKFVAGVREMHEKLQKCAAERVVPATVALVYDYAPLTSVRCDPQDCVYDDPDVKALACTDQQKREITFKEKSAYPGADTILHELAHATGHVDNQTTEEHRYHGRHPLRDEIYFWERHCFRQPDLLRLMREELGKRLEAAKLDRHGDDAGALKRIHAEAYEVCARPFRYNVRRRFRAAEAEVRSVCRQYADFLMMEINLERMQRRLTAEAGDCSVASDKVECPAPAFFTPGSPEAAILEEADLVPPPRGKYSGKAFGDWTLKACAFYDGRTTHGNPSGDLYVCAGRLEERASETDRLLKLFNAGVSWDEIGRLQHYFRRLAGKARALHAGPGQYDPLVVDDAPEETLPGLFRASLAECAKPLIKDTRFCADLALGEAPMNVLGALKLHWKPRTLTP